MSAEGAAAALEEKSPALIHLGSNPFCEISAKSIFVILSEAKDLVFSISYEILRSLRSFRMTVLTAFAEVSL